MASLKFIDSFLFLNQSRLHNDEFFPISSLISIKSDSNLSKWEPLKTRSCETIFSAMMFPSELNISPRVKSLSMMHDSYWCYFLNEKELQDEQNSYLERIDNWKIYIERAEKNYSKSEKL